MGSQVQFGGQGGELGCQSPSHHGMGQVSSEMTVTAPIDSPVTVRQSTGQQVTLNQEFKPSDKFVVMGQIQGQARKSICRPGSGHHGPWFGMGMVVADQGPLKHTSAPRALTIMKCIMDPIYHCLVIWTSPFYLILL